MKNLRSLTPACGLVGFAIIALALPVQGQNATQPDVAEADASPNEAPVADAPGSPSPEEDAAGRAVLAKARENLLGKTLEAQIEETIQMGRQHFSATGRYLQGPNLKLRLELRVNVGTSEGELLEVCDGQILWSRQEISAKPKITRRDVKTILSAAARAGQLDDYALTAELGMGGLPALLASIERHMVFAAPRNETIGGQEILVVEGRWNDEFLSRFRRAEEAEVQLPGHLPDRVQLYFDNQHYPRRIVYRRQYSGLNYSTALLTLDFRNIRVNVQFDDSEFHFEPDKRIFVDDITRQYTDRLQLPTGSGP